MPRGTPGMVGILENKISQLEEENRLLKIAFSYLTESNKTVETRLIDLLEDLGFVRKGAE
jgi:hypothetical protein